MDFLLNVINGYESIWNVILMLAFPIVVGSAIVSAVADRKRG